MIPLLRPAPPKLSQAIDELQAMEERGVFSNFGPINTRFEQEMIERFFAGEGACVTVCNATIGLMLAIKEAVGENAKGKFALMPAFTFAAAAHAALWCNLTPLLCDIDPQTWAADPDAEREMLKRYAGQIAVVIPYATFGYPIDLDHYRNLESQFGVPVIIDGAASLGTFDQNQRGFGTGFQGTVAFSMHATKSFAVGEAGLLYSANTARIDRLRTMSSFGFGEPRTATMPGLNGKLSEVTALLGQLRLKDYGQIIADRARLLDRYRAALPGLEFQHKAEGSQAHQFVPALLPFEMRGRRVTVRSQLLEKGITTGAYFSPHLFEQPYFQRTCVASSLPICDEISARMLSLPLFDGMTFQEVDQVTESLRALTRERERPRSPQKSSRPTKSRRVLFAREGRNKGKHQVA
jgi:dTDP-4-amino-4,6-dideoxygalactose transaminase